MYEHGILEFVLNVKIQFNYLFIKLIILIIIKHIIKHNSIIIYFIRQSSHNQTHRFSLTGRV